MTLKKLPGLAGGVLLALFSGQIATASETIKLGISAPMPGAAASWGLGFKWAAGQAVKKVNSEGGITVGGETYMFELHSFDNQYREVDRLRFSVV